MMEHCIFCKSLKVDMIPNSVNTDKILILKYLWRVNAGELVVLSNFAIVNCLSN